MGHVDCELSSEEFELFKSVISKEFCIFEVGLPEEGDVVLEFIFFFVEVLLALYFFELFWLEVVLVF